MKRFMLIAAERAFNEKYPESNQYCNKYLTALYEFDKNGNPIRLVAVDGGEPEDQTFYRDLSWIVDELNKLAEENK